MAVRKKVRTTDIADPTTACAAGFFRNFAAMKSRWALHLIFWLVYWFIYAYTYSRYDGDFGKYALTEGLQMPARMLATYAGFWCLDRWSRFTWLALAGVALADIAGGLLNRLVKFWYVVPVHFPDSTIEFWGWRAAIDIFDCVLATGVALSARLFFQQQALLRREAVLQQEKTAAELQALKSQLHPHFLFNTINNLYALARMKSEKTAPVALQLANLLRFVLYETRKPSIPLEQEARILRDYIALERLRYDEERLRMETEFSLDDPQQPIAPLLLLPLVENAFKHGVGERREEAWVRVSVVLKNKRLAVQVENSVETGTVAQTNPDGIGLGNVRRQLELLYPQKSRLDTGFVQTPDGEPRYAALLTIDFTTDRL